LFGPAGQYGGWGLIPRALMIRTGVSTDIKHILGTGLTVNQNYEVADYGRTP